MTDRDVDAIRSRNRLAIGTPGRYDLLLAAIPAAVLGAVFVGDALGVPFEQALLGGAALASLALFDGLFRRPPTGLRES